VKIIIETVPHLSQRYNTCGDWQWTQTEKEAALHIKVSEFPSGMRNSKYLYEFLVGVHEAIEAIACEAAGIGEKQVDNFDKDPDIEADVQELDIEIGDHPSAPYRKEHCLATGVERILCSVFNIDWYEYESKLIKMTEEYEEKHG
jgi:hypothetical protein